ncbi:MAG: hypothetical protein CR965_01310 [Paludibacter sp.]|nr:MAG: hypothetical protein CR965_01310 [Paludibacter sp.]
MKRIILALILLVTVSFSVNSQSILGKWKTIDDKTGKAKSIVEIYQQKGKIYAKIIDVLDKKLKNSKCVKCSGKGKNKPLIGLVVIKGLKKDGKEWKGGTILDPKSGKKYKCYITLESKNKLKVRGFIGFALLGRTQYWYRVK